MTLTEIQTKIKDAIQGKLNLDVLTYAEMLEKYPNWADKYEPNEFLIIYETPEQEVSGGYYEVWFDKYQGEWLMLRTPYLQTLQTPIESIDNIINHLLTHVKQTPY